MYWDVDVVGTISESVTAIVALLAVGLSACAWLLSKRIFRYQITNELFKEYRSEKMGYYIRHLHDYFRECGSNQDTLVKKYIEDYEKEKKVDDPIHNHRRAVSNFYQQAAILADKDRYIKKTAYEIWKKRDLEIIETIITPIEVRAIRMALGQEPILDEAKYPVYLKTMLRFFRNAPEE
jgi:hypothetical protein